MAKMMLRNVTETEERGRSSYTRGRRVRRAPDLVMLHSSVTDVCGERARWCLPASAVGSRLEVVGIGMLAAGPNVGRATAVFKEKRGRDAASWE